MESRLTERCIICGKPANGTKTYGERHYCDEHSATFTEDVAPIWRATATTLGVMLALMIGGAIGNQLIVSQVIAGEPTGTVRLVIGGLYAIGPALAWQGLILRSYRRSEFSLSPLEPAIFLIAALFAAAITRPIVGDWLAFDLWLSRASSMNRFLTRILITGAFHVFVQYAIIRYVVWQTAAFSRRMDGVLYGLSAGMGYSAAFGLLTMLDAGGYNLLSGGLRLLTQQCAMLTGSIVLGYFMGRNRFENMEFTYLGMGFALATFLTGLLRFAGIELNNTQIGFTDSGFSPWPGMIVTMIVFIASIAAIYGLLKRHNALTIARLETRE
ncbi:MAG: hypothetical protein JXJ17_10665 [Anaerolineae bacterium]|nr:hypothetical protein [Anaerolineae bacterium]